MTETERRVVREFLIRILDALDSSEPARYLALAEHEEAVKKEAEKKGLELLTPLAAGKLFGKSASTVRRAVADGHVHALFALRATARAVSLIELNSAVAYWGKADSQLLAEMRTNGRVFAIGSDVYNVLSPEPLVSAHRKGER